MNRRQQIIARMQDIADRVAVLARYPSHTAPQAAELRDLEAEFDRLNGDRLALDAEHKRLEHAASRALAGRDGAFRFENGSIGGNYRTGTPSRRARLDGDVGELRGRALDVLDGLERSAEHLSRAQLDVLAGLVQGVDGDAAARYVQVAGADAYRSAFRKVMADPVRGQLRWTPAERDAFGAAMDLQRAMNVGLPGQGGYLVPATLDPAIVLTGPGSTNTGLRAVFSTRTTVTDSWAGITSAGAVAHFRAEAAEVEDDSPTLAEKTIPVHRLDVFLPYSIELGMDHAGFEGEMAKVMRDAAEVRQTTAFLRGTGVNEPTGLITAATAAGKSVPTTTADQFAIGDLYKVKRALPARWRARARWLLNEDTLDSVRQLAGDNDSVLDGQTLVGRPYTESSDIDGVIDAGQDNHIGIYGALDQFVIVDRLGAVIDNVGHLFGPSRRMPTGQKGLVLFQRVGSDLLVPDAVRILTA